MKFFDEKTFGKSVYETAEQHNDIASYSYFTEAAEQMLNIRLMNEGYVQDLLANIKTAYDKQMPLVMDGVFAMCKENQKLMHDTVKTFIRDFSATIKEDSRWLKENNEYIKKVLDSGSITLPTSGMLYKYTNIDDNRIPNTDALGEMMVRLAFFVSDLKKASGVAEKRLVMDVEYSNIWDDIHSKNYYNKVRGSSITKAGRDPKSIKSDNFPGALFDFFRNGGEAISPVFSQKDLRDICNSFKTYERLITPARHKLSDIEKMSDDIFGRISNIEGISREYLTDEKYNAIYNKYMALLQNKFYEVEAIMIFAFSAKLDAITKSYIQDRNIIKQIIEIGKTGGVKNE